MRPCLRLTPNMFRKFGFDRGATTVNLRSGCQPPWGFLLDKNMSSKLVHQPRGQLCLLRRRLGQLWRISLPSSNAHVAAIRDDSKCWIIMA
mmetsp:Transcript_10633/g.20490  ORF Transcript_10633/g.20490 Transcript_10633/m.20490 type:complete len:91 (+) Transcript_10633:889-1161(+)